MGLKWVKDLEGWAGCELRARGRSASKPSRGEFHCYNICRVLDPKADIELILCLQ